MTRFSKEQGQASLIGASLVMWAHDDPLTLMSGCAERGSDVSEELGFRDLSDDERVGLIPFLGQLRLDAKAPFKIKHVDGAPFTMIEEAVFKRYGAPVLTLVLIEIAANAAGKKDIMHLLNQVRLQPELFDPRMRDAARVFRKDCRKLFRSARFIAPH